MNYFSCIISVLTCLLVENYRHFMRIAGKYKILLSVQLNEAKTICCLVFPSAISEKEGYWSPNLRKYQEHEKTMIEICKVRLPVFDKSGLLFFSNTSVVRFSPRKS